MTSGSVTDLKLEVLSDGTWSKALRIVPAYSSDAHGECPAALFLKMCHGAQAVFGDAEVLYYARYYTGFADAPLPVCHHTALDANSGAYHLLLEDLSSTHTDAWSVTPSLEHGLAVANAIARLHRCHWGASGLTKLGLHVASAPEFERYFQHVSAGLPHLLAALGDELPEAWRNALLHTFEKHPAMMLGRSHQDVGFTLVHGDVNPGNILAPRNGTGKLYLIDRQPFDWSLQCWLGAADLACLMVLHWEPQYRQRFELQILRGYQTSLSECGVDYPFEQLLWDYRFSVLQYMETAVQWLVRPTDRVEKRWLWEMLLKRTMTAYFDLDCANLHTT